MLTEKKLMTNTTRRLVPTWQAQELLAYNGDRGSIAIMVVLQ